VIPYSTVAGCIFWIVAFEPCRKPISNQQAGTGSATTIIVDSYRQTRHDCLYSFNILSLARNAVIARSAITSDRQFLTTIDKKKWL
jgi:hypothetical protein